MRSSIYEIIDTLLIDFRDVYAYIQMNENEPHGYLTLEDYTKFGKYSFYLTDCCADGVINFWSVMIISGIPSAEYAYSSDIKKVSAIYGVDDFKPDDYDIYGLYHSCDIIDFFNSWEAALDHALDRKTKRTSDRRKKRKDISPRRRYTVLTRDEFRCVLCGASPRTSKEVQLHIDHIIPVSKGGSNSIDNLRTLCAECNIGKGNLMIEDNTTTNGQF